MVALIALLAESGWDGDERRTSAAWSSIGLQVARRGSAVALWEEWHPPTLDGIGDTDAALERARAQLAEWRVGDFDVLTVLDPRYPVCLRLIEQVPPVLFVKGALVADEAGVSVVGSRDASRRGVEMAVAIARGLVGRGISVISGLATGIDTAAHEATLAAGGRPIGVLGTGIDRAYPAANRALHDRVAAAGALVSQFPPDYPPSQTMFRMRNATMAGLGSASVIVEAGERSGSRVHARYAMAHGRPLILTELVADSTQWGTRIALPPRCLRGGKCSRGAGFVDGGDE